MARGTIWQYVLSFNHEIFVSKNICLLLKHKYVLQPYPKQQYHELTGLMLPNILLRVP